MATEGRAKIALELRDLFEDVSSSFEKQTSKGLLLRMTASAVRDTGYIRI